MRAWVEIDLGAIRRNCERIRQEIGSGVDIIAVVKSNAYGHGLTQVVQTVDELVAGYAVISLEEARQVRQFSNKPVLVMGYLDTKEVVDAIEEGFVLSLYDKELFATYERFAARLNRKLQVELKVETGLHRLGVSPEEAVTFLSSQHLFPHLQLVGIFSHLAKASDPVTDEKQLRVLQQLIAEVGDKTAVVPLHLDSSYALGKYKAGYLDAVRVGLALYGVEDVLPGLEASLRCKAVVMQVKKVQKGDGISYNHLFVAPKDMTIAVVAIGYAEGLSTALSNTMDVLLQGQRCPVLGQVCMNLIVVDIGPLEVKRGEEAVILGSQTSRAGDKTTITASELAKSSGLRHHEIIIRLSAALPKIYY